MPLKLRKFFRRLCCCCSCCRPKTSGPVTVAATEVTEEVKEEVEKQKVEKEVVEEVEKQEAGKEKEEEEKEEEDEAENLVLKLRPHFIKVEDSSRQYRPLFARVNFPPFWLKNIKPRVDETVPVQAPAHNIPGSCFCCRVRYLDLEEHLASPQHQAFIQGDNYQNLDALIATLSNDLEEQ